MTEHSMDLVANPVRSRKRNGRRVYNIAAKRELVRRCLEPGVSLAATAMAHGINANLMRKWVVLQGVIWPRFHGLLTVCKRGVRDGQVKVREAIRQGISPADGGAAGSSP